MRVLKPAFNSLSEDIEAKTSEELISKSGLNFEVVKVRNIAKYTPEGKATLELETDSYSTVRTDTMQVLGSTLGSVYDVIQNKQAFKFIDDLVENAGLIYKRAFCTNRGANVYIMGELPKTIILSNVSNDIIKILFNASFSHDGTKALTLSILPYRLICSNGLVGIDKQLSKSVNIRHTPSAHEKLGVESITALKLIDTSINNLEMRIDGLRSIPVNDKEMVFLLAKTMLDDMEYFIDGEGDFGFSNKISTRKLNIFRAVVDSVVAGVGQELPSINNTLFGVFNGVSYYLNNIKNYSSEEQRFQNTYISGGVNLLEKLSKNMGFIEDNIKNIPNKNVNKLEIINLLN